MSDPSSLIFHLSSSLRRRSRAVGRSTDGMPFGCRAGSGEKAALKEELLQSPEFREAIGINPNGNRCALPVQAVENSHQVRVRRQCFVQRFSNVFQSGCDFEMIE